MVYFLVEKGADINGKCLNGSTPLHAAAFYGFDKIVEFLLLNGAN